MKTRHWLTALALCVAGCGGAPAYREDPAHTEALYQQIHQDEATIERSRASLMTSAVECPDACRASGAICEAAEHLCRVARELGDDDALVRCRRAEQACAEAREHVATDCVCSATSPDATAAEPL